jgi:hypothetical protein
MKVKSLRRHVNGSGTIKAQKISISVTKRRKTCTSSKSKHKGNMVKGSARLGGRKGRGRATCSVRVPLNKQRYASVLVLFRAGAHLLDCSRASCLLRGRKLRCKVVIVYFEGSDTADEVWQVEGASKGREAAGDLVEAGEKLREGRSGLVWTE